MNEGLLGPRHDDRQGGRGDAGVHPSAGCGRRVHPVQRKDEQRRRNEVSELSDGVDHRRAFSPGFVSVLNIFSMRSVMRKPLTMFVIDAKSAMAPRMRIRSG